jgi:branched-chain amino acid transport system ATP-binding protein
LRRATEPGIEKRTSRDSGEPLRERCAGRRHLVHARAVEDVCRHRCGRRGRSCGAAGLDLLTRFLAPSRGTIRFAGQDITRVGAAEVARRGLVRSFQISAVFPGLSLLENVAIALQRKRGGSFDFWRSETLLRAYDEAALALLDEVGLAGFAQSRAADLSYGRKRALELATTLALDPTVMLLDEPMAGMAHEDIDRMVALIDRAARNRTVLMVEHNLSVVASLSDRITVLARGKVLAEGDYATVSQDPRVIEAYIGVGHG